MNSISQKTNVYTKTHAPRFSSMIVRSGKFNANDFIEKRKQVDNLRIERIKEIGNTIDHIAKNEFKQTVEIIGEVMPFVKNIKGLDKFLGNKDDTPSVPEK